MNNACVISVISSALLSLSAAAATVDISKLPPPAAKTGVTYAKEIRPILQASCFGCHGEERQKGELRLDSLESALQGGKHKVIVPGKSAESPLVIAVSRLDEKHAMPPKPREGRGPGGPRPNGPAGAGEAPTAQNRSPGQGGGRGMGPQAKALTAEQVSLIRAWIDQGAK
jgi:hypothetical protein